ncbi:MULTISPECIES: hypothetical protein, partial [unclassified Pseudomonas]|uniref:hypothetical protein n=1 Tax=unclassified Pseudomonas TaxID=196821 RepID=UPI0021BAABAF
SGFVQLFPRKKLPAVKAEGASSAATNNGSAHDLNAKPPSRQAAKPPSQAPTTRKEPKKAEAVDSADYRSTMR